MMKMKRHCDLCQHQVLSLKRGSVCGVTKKKPDFNGTCIKIRFGSKLKDELGELHVNLEDLIMRKKRLTISLIIKPIFGSIVVVIGYLLRQHILNKGFIAFIPAFIIAVGFYLIKSPFSINNDLTLEIQQIENNIKDIDTFLKMYQVSYKSNVVLGEEIHGIQESKSDIQIFKSWINLLKNS